MRGSPVRGELYWIDWSPARGSEQGATRPGLVVQTDVANANTAYPLTVIVAVSSSGRAVPFHVPLEPNDANGLTNRSYAKCEQIVTVAKDRLGRRIGQINPNELLLVDQALRAVLSL